MDNPYVVLLSPQAFARLVAVLEHEWPLDLTERIAVELLGAIHLADESHLCVDEGWPHYSKRGGDDEQH